VIAAHQFLVFWVDGVAGNAVLSWERLTPTAAAFIAWPLLVAMLDRLRLQLRMQP
jgi:rod shape-determining protein MreD